jgi:hypothetical protein
LDQAQSIDLKIFLPVCSIALVVFQVAFLAMAFAHTPKRSDATGKKSNHHQYSFKYLPNICEVENCSALSCV